MFVEQAIFTSVRSSRMDGYQLAAASPGVSSEDSKALLQWGPAHDSLQDVSSYASSVNFHELPSGRFAISRTRHQGKEYSSRGGHRVYTHYLITEREDLASFSFHPFRVLDAAEVAGYLDFLDELDDLEPLYLGGKASPLNGNGLARLSHTLGTGRLLQVLDTALCNPRLAIHGELRVTPRRLIDGLLDLIPPRQRLEFSLTTGLKVSSRRPFRMVYCRAEQCPRTRAATREGITVLDLSEIEGGDPPPAHPWAALVAPLMRQHRLGELARLLRACDACDDTHSLEQVAEQMAAPASL